MQNRYVGDVGDYAKFGLLRALSSGKKLGVAWYLYPDEGHNTDGKHVEYLRDPNKWQHFDPKLFGTLKRLIETHRRNISSLEAAELLDGAEFWSDELSFNSTSFSQRSEWRQSWFQSLCSSLDGCDIVFADPDNGLCADDNFSFGKKKNWKRMPLSEAKALAENRTAIIYHHNSRFKGGHRKEIEHWIEQVDAPCRAVYWRKYSNRTFFIINPTLEIDERLALFGYRWNNCCELIGLV